MSLEARKYAAMLVNTLMTEEEFRALGKEWNGLLHRSQSNNIFLTWEWMYTWWKHYGAGKDLFVVTVRGDDGVLIGLAPMCIKKVSFHGLASLKAITFLGTEDVCSDYLDIIASPETHEMVVKAVFDYLDENSKSWDFIILSDVLADSGSYRHIISELDSRKAGYFLSDEKECPYISLPESYEAYVTGLSKNTRYNLARRARNLDAGFFTYDGSESIEKVMEKLFELHGKRMESKTGGRSNFLLKKLTDFHMEAARVFNDNGALRIYSLLVGGEPVAMLYGFRYMDKFFYYQAGMDPDYEKQSAGMVLMANCIRDSIESGLKEFDFLRGSEAYKYKWTGTSRKIVNIVLRSGSLKGKALMSVEAFLMMVKNIVRPGNKQKTSGSSRVFPHFRRTGTSG